MRTIPQLFESSVERYPLNTLIWEKLDGAYRGVSYQDIHNEIKALAFGLIGLGINKGDRVALLADGSRKWLVAELAVLYIGAISVPLSVKINEPTDLQFRLEHSGSKYIFVSESEYGKVKSIRSKLSQLSHIIQLDGKTVSTERCLHYNDLIKPNEGSTEKMAIEFKNRMESIQEDDLANISYTSGTTADPKGIMLTHRNYTANVEQACSLFEVPEWYVTLLILSWDHSFAHTTGLYVMIKNGASIAVVDPGKSAIERLRNIPENIKEIKPSFQLSVPALARSVKKGIESSIKSKGKFTENLFQTALKTANTYYGDGWEKKGLSKIFLKLLIMFYDKVLFSKIRENFGGRLKFFIGGGALLDIELQNFFYAIGIPMFQGYGLTEASPIISSNTPDQHKLGSSGRVVDKLEIKILDDDGKACPLGGTGEIAVKGENVMKGYWKNEKATSETLKNGWLHTGDRGYLDQDGFLYVLGRFKSLLIGNDGEKYSPEGIEETLIDGSKYIDQCMLHNNQNIFTVGLIVPNKNALGQYLTAKGLDKNTEEATNEVIGLLKLEVAQYYQGGKYENMFPERWLPTSIGILEHPFTEKNGMINSTLKMVRPKVEEQYHELIGYLYTSEGKNAHNPKNRKSVSVLLDKNQI